MPHGFVQYILLCNEERIYHEFSTNMFIFSLHFHSPDVLKQDYSFDENLDLCIGVSLISSIFPHQFYKELFHYWVCFVWFCFFIFSFIIVVPFSQLYVVISFNGLLPLFLVLYLLGFPVKLAKIYQMIKTRPESLSYLFLRSTVLYLCPQQKKHWLSCKNENNSGRDCNNERNKNKQKSRHSDFCCDRCA